MPIRLPLDDTQTGQIAVLLNSYILSNGNYAGYKTSSFTTAAANVTEQKISVFYNANSLTFSNAIIDCMIKDSKGNIIRTLGDKVLGKEVVDNTYTTSDGTVYRYFNDFYWDGKNDSGKYVPDGAYKVYAKVYYPNSQIAEDETCTINLAARTVISLEIDKKTLTLSTPTSMLGVTPKNPITDNITATINDEAVIKTITWSSSNTSVATVDENGKVTAVAKGTAVITAKTDGLSETGKPLTATCTVTVKQTATGASITPAAISVKKGFTAIPRVTVLPATSDYKNGIWSIVSQTPVIDGQTVITIDSSTGTITAVHGGTAVIKYTTEEGASGTADVTVVAPVESVSLSEASKNLERGKGFKLIPEVLPDEAVNKAVTWTSSNEKVAIVDTDGNVTAISAGTAKITAKTVDGSKTAICIVNVTSSADGITLSSSSETIQKGKFVKLTATVLPADAQNKTVTWSVTNTDGSPIDDNVVTVDSTGKVTAVGTSDTKTAIVWATNATGKKAGCVVTVTVPVTGVALSSDSIVSGKLNFTIGNTPILPVQLTANVAPLNADNKNVTWTSSNANVATVSETGLVTATGKGMAVITVTTSDGSKKATVTVNVVQQVTELTLNYSELEIGKGKSVTLIPSILPYAANTKVLNWSITGNEVTGITVVNGKVTVAADAVIPEGVTAKVVAETTDGSNLKAECIITIADSVTSLSMKGGNQTLYANGTEAQQTYDYDVTSGGNPYSDSKVTWKSSNIKVATVDSTGKVTAIGKGTAIITATANDGSLKSASATITVKKLVESITLSKTSLTLAAGKSATVTAAITPVDADLKTLTWTVDNDNINNIIITNGTIKAVSACTGAKITVSANDGSDVKSEITVNVEANLTKTISISSTDVNINTSGVAYIIDINKSAKLDALAVGTDGNSTGISQDFIWTSSNSNVIAVDDNGNITAISKGTAVITVASTDGSGVRATKTINVNVPVTGVSLSNTELFLSKGRTAVLKAIVTPDDANNKTVTWSITGSATITVNPTTGLVTVSSTAVAGDTATVTATTADGLKTASCIITVVGSQVTSVSLDKRTYIFENATAGAVINKTCQLTANILPLTAAVKDITWSSDNVNVVTVDANGLVTAKGYGTAKVTATTKDGGKTAYCTFTVYPIPASYVLSPLNASQNIELKSTGGTTSCNVQVINQFYNAKTNNAVLDSSLFTYTSSDTSVATVDNTGKVTAADNGKIGTTTITATVKNDPLGRSVTFMVSTKSKQVTSIKAGYSITKTDGTGIETKEDISTMAIPFVSGQRIEITALQYAADGTQIVTAPTWTCADTSIATVTAVAGSNTKAVITLRKAGSTTIIIKAKDTFGLEKKITLYAYDFTPKLSGTISVNRKSIPSGLIYTSNAFGINPVYGTGIENIAIKSVKVGTTYLPTSRFEIAGLGGNSYAFKMTDDANLPLKNGSYIVTADMTISGTNIKASTGLDEITVPMTFTVTVTDVIPTVTAAVSDINLFYNGMPYPLTFTTSGVVTDVSIGGAAASCYNLSKANGTWYISSKPGFATAGMTTGTLTVALDGYSQTVSVPLTVNAYLTAPVLTPSAAVTLKSSAVNSAQFTITNTTDKTQLTGFTASLVSGVSTNSKFNEPTVSDGGVITLTLNDTATTDGTYTAQVNISKSGWVKPIVVRLSIILKSTSVTARLSTSSVTLNKLVSTDSAKVSVITSQSNVAIANDDMTIKYIKAGIPQNDLPENMMIVYGDGIVTVGFDGGVTPIGSYMFKLTPSYNGIELSSLTLTVRVVATAPTATVTKTGTIDLLNRASTESNFMFRLSNTSATISNVTIPDDCGFTGTYSAETGLYTVKANDDADLQATTYRIPAVITLLGGYTINTVLTFAPVQTVPVLDVIPTVTYYKGTDDHFSLTEIFTVSGKTAEISLVQDATLNNNDFTVSIDKITNSVTIALENPALKPGTYTFTFNVYFKGAAMSYEYPNGVPQIQTITVVVI